MVYPALLSLMRTTRLAVVDWTDAPRRFKRTRPFRRKTKSGFCACVIIFQLASTSKLLKLWKSAVPLHYFLLHLDLYYWQFVCHILYSHVSLLRRISFLFLAVSVVQTFLLMLLLCSTIPSLDSLKRTDRRRGNKTQTGYNRWIMCSYWILHWQAFLFFQPTGHKNLVTCKHIQMAHGHFRWQQQQQQQQQQKQQQQMLVLLHITHFVFPKSVDFESYRIIFCHTIVSHHFWSYYRIASFLVILSYRIIFGHTIVSHNFWP